MEYPHIGLLQVRVGENSHSVVKRMAIVTRTTLLFIAKVAFGDQCATATTTDLIFLPRESFVDNWVSQTRWQQQAISWIYHLSLQSLWIYITPAYLAKELKILCR